MIKEPKEGMQVVVLKPKVFEGRVGTILKKGLTKYLDGNNIRVRLNKVDQIFYFNKSELIEYKK